MNNIVELNQIQLQNRQERLQTPFLVDIAPLQPHGSLWTSTEYVRNHWISPSVDNILADNIVSPQVVNSCSILIWNFICENFVAHNLQSCPTFSEISFIRIEKSTFLRWRRNSKVNTSSGSHRKYKTREKTETNKKQKTHTSMNKSASLTPVQGPSTVVCMIVT